VTYLRGAGYQEFRAGWHVTLRTTTVGLRLACGRPATRSVSLGSDAGALDTPYSNMNTTIPTKGQAIPRQLSVAHGCPKTLVFCLMEMFNPEPIVFYYLSVNSSVYDIFQNTILKS
jgi:hypothetical protein